MNASKEECRKAYKALEKMLGAHRNGLSILATDADQLRDFLVAAERKLPSEASYAKEKTVPCPKCLGKNIVPLPRMLWARSPGQEDGEGKWICLKCTSSFTEEQRLRLHDTACVNAAAEAATSQVPDLPMPKSKHKEGPKGWGEETGM